VETVDEGQRSRALEVLEGLYDECGEAVYTYALGMLGRREDAEDAVQAVWLRLARRPERLLEVGNRCAYVWAAARNQVRSVFRARSRERAFRGELGEPEMLPAGANPGADRDALRDMERAVARLSRKHREVVVLVGFEGLTLEESAERLGIPRGTAASRYRSGVKTIRRFLGARAGS